MTKAYIVHYVGYDYNDTDSRVAQGMTYELPEEIHATKESATEEFEAMIAEELQNWNLNNAEMERDEECFYISEKNPERWTEIRIKCVTIKNK